jgi:UDP-GlcNAc:undecaprenyl-phosphate/decaprenyl-phosphate GlcNAc-1-phosphate transferase
LHAGILVGWSVMRPDLSPAIWIAIALLYLVSFVDDLVTVHAAARFGVHVIAGVLLSLTAVQLGYAAAMIAALAAAWMANVFNFMDGADGLAGGMAAIGFSFYAVAAYAAGDMHIAGMSLVTAASAMGFLIFNFHPARIFMGDVGSVPLGFIAAMLGLEGVMRNVWPIWFPVLVFSPFIIDASLTLAVRMFRRERIWEAHCSHYYQRLIRSGWGHRQTAYAEYGLMVICGTSALVALGKSLALQVLILAAVAALYVAAIVTLELVWRCQRNTE